MVVGECVTEKATFENNFEGNDRMNLREIWKQKNNDCEETGGQCGWNRGDLVDCFKKKIK